MACVWGIIDDDGPDEVTLAYICCRRERSLARGDFEPRSLNLLQKGLDSVILQAVLYGPEADPLLLAVTNKIVLEASHNLVKELAVDGGVHVDSLDGHADLGALLVYHSRLSESPTYLARIQESKLRNLKTWR